MRAAIRKTHSKGDGHFVVLIRLSERQSYACKGVDGQLINDHIKAVAEFNQSEPAGLS